MNAIGLDGLKGSVVVTDLVGDTPFDWTTDEKSAIGLAVKWLRTQKDDRGFDWVSDGEPFIRYTGLEGYESLEYGIWLDRIGSLDMLVLHELSGFGFDIPWIVVVDGRMEVRFKNKHRFILENIADVMTTLKVEAGTRLEAVLKLQKTKKNAEKEADSRERVEKFRVKAQILRMARPYETGMEDHLDPSVEKKV